MHSIQMKLILEELIFMQIINRSFLQQTVLHSNVNFINDRIKLCKIILKIYLSTLMHIFTFNSVRAFKRIQRKKFFLNICRYMLDECLLDISNISLEYILDMRMLTAMLVTFFFFRKERFNWKIRLRHLFF